MKSSLIWLVRLFPRAFREQFGLEMIEHIAEDYRHARSRGWLPVIGYTAVTAADLIRSAIGERWHPTRMRACCFHGGKRHAVDTDDWARDLRHAARALSRAPGFTLVTAGTLGLAIGVNAGMFSVVNRVLLDPLPFANAERLVHIGASAPGSDFPPEFGVSQEFFVQYREHSKPSRISRHTTPSSTLRVDDRVERVRMSWPTNSMYSTLGVSPILGRLPVSEDEDRVAVISYGLWTRGLAGIRRHRQGLRFQARSARSSASWDRSSASPTTARCSGSRVRSAPIGCRSADSGQAWSGAWCRERLLRRWHAN
jgi:hypothetical protein